MRLPNFFIVGAPKCGTTALYHSLRQHPEVFLPYSKEEYWRYKEPFHFCSDLGLADWLRVSDEGEYAALFEPAGDASKSGEATAWYLYSPEAGPRIKQRCGPDTKIIIMLRPPVAWMRSWHHDLLRYGYEDIGDFREALNAEDARGRGERMPARAVFSGCLCYRKAARFSGQVERMFQLFGRGNVFVGLMEDLARGQEDFVAEVLRFLDVDDSIRLKPERENDSAVLRGTHLFDLKVSRAFDRLPGGGIVKKLWASGPERVYSAVVDKSLPPLSDKSIDPALERELREEFRDEVNALSELLGRDLSHWNKPK